MLRTLTGTFAELFPGSSDFPGDVSILVLEVERDGQTTRLLVPGSETYAPENSPTLVHDGSAEVTYLLWEGMHNGVHPQLYLRSFDGVAWGEQIELSGSPFTRKSHPQLVVTRDRSMEPAADGVAVEKERAILHVFWWEEIDTELHKRYAPLVLESGHFIGAHPVHDLSQSLVPTADSVFLSSFGDVLKVQAGPDMSSVVAGFVEQDLGRLVAVKVGVTPRALSRLAESVVDFIQGQDAATSPADLAVRVRDHIAVAGASLHPATLEYLKQNVLALVSAIDPTLLNGGMSNVAGQVGAHILVIGRYQGVEIDTAELPLGVITAARADGSRPWHHINVSRVGNWVLPQEATPTAHYFFSKSGKSACVAWQIENRVYYRETVGMGWSDARTIDISPTLSLDAVLSILEQRTLGR